MEDEARHILRGALAATAAPQRNLAESVRLRFEPLGAVDIRLPAGRPISHFDAQIAAIAYAAGAGVATRNTLDFEGCGVRVVNPWSD